MTAIFLAANRGDVGGGEIMLLRLADGLGKLGYVVTVVAPSTPGDVASRARDRGLSVQEIACHDRLSYARGLRRWDRTRRGLLWCNGLLPAFASSGHPQRVVHLHQEPRASQRLYSILARRGAHATIVPSHYLQSRLDRAEVLHNWTDDLPGHRPPEASDDVVVGFLGRIGRAKGVHVLAAACALLDEPTRRRIRLVVAGDDRFVPKSDQRQVLESLAASGVRVEKPGWIDRQAFFASVNLAVFPSVWGEPFGLVVAEAMSASCPVVVSDAGALPEVVGTDYPWIARHGDERALAATLSTALSQLPAAELVAAQRQRWMDLFSPPAGLRGLERLMTRLADRGVVSQPHRIGGDR